MGKNKPKRNKKPIFPEDSMTAQSVNEAKKSFKKFNFKLFFKEFLIFLVMFGYLETANHFAYTHPIFFYSYHAYFIILLILLVTCLILNKGVSMDTPTKDQLADSLTDEQKEKYITSLEKGHKQAKKLLVFIVPLLFTLFFDYLLILFA